MASRRYEQRIRAATAEDTRRRILDAMRERIRSAPTEELSIDRVAQDAGVARSTIYVVFGSRAGLFEALGEDLLSRAGFQRIVDAVSLPDPREALRASLRASCEVYAAERDVARVLASNAALNPGAFGGVFDVLNRGRAEGLRHLATRLKRDDVLRHDVSIKEATEILWVITSFDVFDQLYSSRGLTAQAVGRRLIAMAERAICVGQG